MLVVYHQIVYNSGLNVKSTCLKISAVTATIPGVLEGELVEWFINGLVISQHLFTVFCLQHQTYWPTFFNQYQTFLHNSTTSDMLTIMYFVCIWLKCFSMLSWNCQDDWWNAIKSQTNVKYFIKWYTWYTAPCSPWWPFSCVFYCT